MSVFREALMFLDMLGVYDVVLPLLLVFSIVFALLEKTKVFGEEKVGDKKVTRKNVNAMVAFVTAFFVVASAQLVAIINELVAGVVLVLITFVMFMILIGVFSKDEALSLEGGWQKTFMIISFVSIVLIFFNTLGWLEFAWSYFAYNWDSALAGTIFLLLVIVGFIYWVAKEPTSKDKKD